jgi:hypothetical protein
MNGTAMALAIVASFRLAWAGDAVQQESEAHAAQNHAVTPLLAAVASLDEVRVRTLLQAGANPDDPLAARSPLVQAITRFNPAKGRELFCSIGIVKALLDHGADPNRADPTIGSLPLEDAFGVGDLTSLRGQCPSWL